MRGRGQCAQQHGSHHGNESPNRGLAAGNASFDATGSTCHRRRSAENCTFGAGLRPRNFCNCKERSLMESGLERNAALFVQHAYIAPASIMLTLKCRGVQEEVQSRAWIHFCRFRSGGWKYCFGLCQCRLRKAKDEPPASGLPLAGSQYERSKPRSRLCCCRGQHLPGLAF